VTDTKVFGWRSGGAFNSFLRFVGITNILFVHQS
jgi:hypothetical protein